MTASSPDSAQSASCPPTPDDTRQTFRLALPWVAFITVLFLFNYMSRASLSPLLVQVEAGLGIGHAAAGSLLFMQSVGMSLSLAASGFLLSRVKPRTVLAGSLCLSGTILLCMFAVDSLISAQMLFFLFGFMAGPYFPAGIATLATLVHAKDWGKAVGFHELAPNVGFILIPLFAQAGLLFTDWQGVFMGMGTFMIVIGLTFALWGRGGSVLTTRPSFGECRSLFKNPASWAAALLLSVGTIGEFSIFSILQLFLVNDVQFSPETANILLSLSRAAAPFVVLLGGFAADRWNPGNAVRGCFVVHTIALLLMSLDPETMRVAVLIGIFLQAVSIAFVFPPILKLLAGAFPASEQPMVLSMSLPLAGLSATGLAPFFLGFCGQYLSFATGFFTLAVLSALTIFSVKTLKKKS